MTIKKIDHIAIVVENLENALGVYRDALGMTVTDVREMPEQDVKMAFLPAGDSEIELLEPLHADSGIGKYLAKRGEGLHHVCLEVDDIEATLADLQGQGRATDRRDAEAGRLRPDRLHPPQGRARRARGTGAARLTCRIAPRRLSHAAAQRACWPSGTQPASGPALTPAQVEANIRHLVGDIAWFGVVVGHDHRRSSRSTRCASARRSLLVGAITYGPALIAIFWQIPAGRLITRKGHRMRWVLLSGLAYRGIFLAVALIPFFIARATAQTTALVWVLLGHRPASATSPSCR